MKKQWLTAVVIGAAVLVGGATMAVLAFGPEPAEDPPCSACSALPEFADRDIPTVAFCDLLASQQAYAGRLVRVRALLHNDACYWSLYARDCGDGYKAIATAYARDVRACDGVRANLESLAGIGYWYDGTADVVVVGRIGGIDDPDSCRQGDSGFEIVCLEQASPRPGDFYGPWLLRRNAQFAR